MNKKIRKECESSCEYILPDYMGDIRKILMSRAKATPTGRFLSAEVLEVSGMVEYEVLYADSEGKLTAISATSDYEVKIPIDQDRYIDSFEECSVTNLGIRITGPRKVVMKAAVEANVRVSEETEIEIEGDVFSSDSEPETAVKVITYETSYIGRSGEREYAEAADFIADVRADDVEILTTGGSVRISEAIASEDGVKVKGELIIVAIVRTPNQPPFAIKKSIPFEETVAVEGVSANMQAIASGYITSATVGLNDGDGGCELTVNAIAEFVAEGFENESMEVVVDAYLKERETENKYSDFGYKNLDTCRIFEFTSSLKVSRDAAGCADAREIIASLADLRSCDAKICEGGVNFEGEILVSAVACEIFQDGSVGYIPVKIQLPFNENVNFDCQIPEKCDFEYTLEPIESSIELDNEDFYIKCMFSGRAFVRNCGSVKRLASCVACGAASEPSPSHITVYYPEKGETLFEVAKKFHTTSIKIAADNSLAESVFNSDSQGSLNGVRKLIIR